MTLVLIALAAAAGIYQLLALAAAIRHFLGGAGPRPVQGRSGTCPTPISILKPVRGIDPHFYEAIRSHAVQDYPEYEIVFGVRDSDDPCIPEIERLRAEFPGRAIRLVMTSHKDAPNRKVGTLIDLAAAARYPILIVNDGDVRVPPDYLRRVVVPLDDPKVGLVTCLYSAKADNWPSRWEMLGVVTDFPASVLVARLLGVAEFGLGATLAFRAEQLRQFGGFEALADYIADDYQLGKHIADLGYRVALSPVVVETNLGAITWGDAWRHQLRWARTIRLSRSGYAGIPITHAIVWILLAAVRGLWWLALPLLALDLTVSLLVGVVILKCPDALKYFYLIPLRDLWALAVWAAGLFGNTVTWRGSRLKLDKQGRIVG